MILQELSGSSSAGPSWTKMHTFNVASNILGGQRPKPPFWVNALAPFHMQVPTHSEASGKIESYGL